MAASLPLHATIAEDGMDPSQTSSKRRAYRCIGRLCLGQICVLDLSQVRNNVLAKRARRRLRREYNCSAVDGARTHIETAPRLDQEHESYKEEQKR